MANEEHKNRIHRSPKDAYSLRPFINSTAHVCKPLFERMSHRGFLLE